MSALSSTGFGLVAALAWNDAIQELFRVIFGTANTLVAKFVYAAFITVVVVVLTTRLSRVASRLKALVSSASLPK
ncbi:hypothetical protein EPN90_04875 [Patescibacteria group bacterium]|nr:MAG: hypothetical protein EPN90_04875 [Patescibacteria group bacterium]